MDFELSDDQRAIQDALGQIIAGHGDLPSWTTELPPARYVYAEAMSRELESGAFFDLALTEGCSALDAALLVYNTAKSPLVLETFASGFVAPLVFGHSFPRPVAIARLEDLPRGVRFLDRAQTVVVDCGDCIKILDAATLNIEPMETMFAFPIGRCRDDISSLKDATQLDEGKIVELRSAWRTALALEVAGLMQAALDFTTEYVKERRVFSRPVGSFQAVQHRLAMDAQTARSLYWLALRAAWSGGARDAAAAAQYAQLCSRPVIYDTHQFNGAMGMTLEHSLHFWTFRLRWLQSELNALGSHASEIANHVWPD